MPREDMIADFEYLMTALEESWPFFNLSISANGVDVHALANDTRALLNDLTTDLDSPLDFLDIIQEHFFEPIDQLGHLRQIASYESFFDAQRQLQWSIEHGAIDRFTAYLYDLFHRPEAVMFYSLLRDAGRGIPSPQTQTGSVMEFDSLEEGRTAYMRVNRMISIWDDTVAPQHNMWQNELRTYNFTEYIQDFEHLIIDFRGNPGGTPMQFIHFIMPMFLNEGITLDAFVFYMDGKYANLAREVFDIRNIYPVWMHYDMELYFGMTEEPIFPQAYFSEPLPYLDHQINFSSAFEVSFEIEGKYWMKSPFSFT